MLVRSKSARLWRSSAAATLNRAPALEALTRRQLHLPVSAQFFQGWSTQERPLAAHPQQRRSTARWARASTHLCLLKRPPTGCAVSTASGRFRVASFGAHRPYTRAECGGCSRPRQLQHSTMAPLAAASFAEPHTYAEQLRVKVPPVLHNWCLDWSLVAEQGFKAYQPTWWHAL